MQTDCITIITLDNLVSLTGVTCLCSCYSNAIVPCGNGQYNNVNRGLLLFTQLLKTLNKICELISSNLYTVSLNFLFL